MKKILVIDDEETTRKIICNLLEAQNYAVILASNGRKALGIIEDNQDLDLIITDMQMPEINGREFISMYRSLYTTNIPVIMISGIINLKEISDLLNNGVDRFMPKPVNSKELLGYIEDLT